MTEEQIIRLYGERCAEHCDDCCVCEVWAMHDLIETQAREIERLRERWAMIDQLRGAEGCSVEIIHDNPDPGASNCAIYVTDNFGEDYSTYYGDTVDDCLRQAVEARAALGASHDQ